MINWSAILSISFVLVGCSILGHPIERESCETRLHCEKVAALSCSNGYTIHSITYGDPEGEEWDHEGLSGSGNVARNILSGVFTAMNSEPWVVVYQCKERTM